MICCFGIGIICGPYLPPELLDSYRVEPKTEAGRRLKAEREARPRPQADPSLYELPENLKPAKDGTP